MLNNINFIIENKIVKIFLIKNIILSVPEGYLNIIGILYKYLN